MKKNSEYEKEKDIINCREKQCRAALEGNKHKSAIKREVI